MKFFKSKYVFLSALSRIRKNLDTNIAIGISDINRDMAKDIMCNLYEVMENCDVLYFSNDIVRKIQNREFKFMEDLTRFYSEDLSDRAVVLLSPRMTMVYSFWLDEDGFTLFDISFFTDCILVFHNSGRILKNGKVEVCYSVTDIVGPMAKEDYISLFSTAVDFIVFRKFAPIETVILDSSNSKAKVGKEKHIIDKDLDVAVNVVDSSWFRNIIRLEGFAVKGHFRLQPYGVGRTKKRLVWINEFEKKGYSKKARKS